MTFSTSPGVGFTVSKNENIFHKEKSVLKYVEHTTNDLRKKKLLILMAQNRFIQNS